MAIPSSTQLNKQFSDVLSPQELQDHLNSILRDVLTPGVSIKGDGRAEMVTLLRDLCCIMMGEFPRAGTTEWHLLKDRIQIIDISLNLIDRALICVEDIIGRPDRLERTVLAQSFVLHGILETWLSSMDYEDNYPDGPTFLQKRLRTIALNMLMVMSGAPKQQGQTSWQCRSDHSSLVICLEECLTIAEDLPLDSFVEPRKVTFFKKAQITEKSEENGITLTLETSIMRDALVANALNLAIHASVPLMKIGIVPDIPLRAAKIASLDLYNLLVDATDIPLSRRIAMLSYLIDAILPLFSAKFINVAVFSPFVHRIVIKRQREGVHTKWNKLDERLIRILEVIPVGVRIETQTSWFQEAIMLRSSDEEDNSRLEDMLFAYIHINVPMLNEESLRQILPLLTRSSPSSKLTTLTSSIEQRLDDLEGHQNVAAVSDSKTFFPNCRSSIWWEEVYKKILYFFPTDITSGVHLRNIGEVDWCTSIIQEIAKGVIELPYLPQDEGYNKILKHLTELPCFMFHEDGSQCSRALLVPGVSFVPAFTKIGQHLLHCVRNSANSNILCCIYECLWQAVKHQSQNVGREELEDLLSLVKYGMQRQERSIRKKAGLVLVDMLAIYPSIAETSMHGADPIIRTVNEILHSDSLGIIETTLITIGKMGRVAEAEVLGRLLECIITQLGHQNPVIKGLAYIQLLELNRHYGKGPYGLLAPYLPAISLAIVSNVSTNPEQLLQTCNFLSMSPSKFYNLTLVHFLPHLVCSCNGDTLLKVAKELRKSPVSLVTTHEVLARVFLLNGQEETNKVFRFILNLLTQEKGPAAGQITVLMLVKSTVVPLLGEIVIAMGDEDAAYAQQARDAIWKVDHVLFPEGHSGNSPLIHDYMMGIVSHLNEVLQDAHGKRPLETKKKVLRSLGALVELAGWQITSVAPQIMATMQSMLPIPALANATLESWYIFITTLALEDIGPYIGPTSATFVITWPELKTEGRDFVKRAFNYLICDNGDILKAHFNEFVSLESIEELEPYSSRLRSIRAQWSLSQYLDNILTRAVSYNLTVAELSVQELKQFMAHNQEYIQKLASGDVFDPIISRLVCSLWEITSRDGDGADTLRLLAYDCIGQLGAVDPDRLELVAQDTSMIIYHNFKNEEESINFAVYLIKDVLLGTYRSTSDIKFQSHLAFAIQELLKFCGFTKELVSSTPANAVPLKTRSRWANLPRHVWEACVPLLEAKYTRTSIPTRTVIHPIYPTKTTYREWMQDWTAHLIGKVSVPRAKAIFDVFSAVVIDKDVGVARHLLPHIVLHILISGTDVDAQNIKSEIVAVLRDQVEPSLPSSSDRRLLCAQSIFMLMDHLNKWIRVICQHISQCRAESRRSRTSDLLVEHENNLVKVDSLLSSIDHELIAKAAFECKAFARSLMGFERQIQFRLASGVPNDDLELQAYYERLHEIYSHLDEPDGMEGVTSCVLDLSLEHQIRQHESTGRWTSAQSCWEVRLQESPDNLEFHLGLMRCLRNLGHYDTLRTHIKGVLSRNPHWDEALSGFQAEAAWIVGDWQTVQELCQIKSVDSCPEIILARVLLAMREEETSKISAALVTARSQLGAPIYAAGRGAYRRVYDSVLNLHLVRDAEMIYEATFPRKNNHIQSLSKTLSRRFESTLPSFRIREPILSLQRTVLSLRDQDVKSIIGTAWLATSKIARKAGHAQTAYSAVLQARRMDAPFTFLQSVKLVKAVGEPIRALQELDKVLTKSVIAAEKEIVNLAEDSDLEVIRMKAKAQVLRAQWMHDAERYDKGLIHKGFKEAVNLAPSWESAHFHLGNFYDRQFVQLSALEREAAVGRNLNYETIKCYGRTLQAGSKYVYQTMPRLLTLWLDLGEKDSSGDSLLHRTNNKVNSAVRSIATYKWLTAFPQIVSRIDHPNAAVFDLLSNLIIKVLEEYPHQGAWLFISVVQSKKHERNRRGEMVIHKLATSTKESTNVVHIVNQCRTMTNEFLKLCSYPVPDDPKTALSMAKLFPGLVKLTPSQLIVPLQESLIASLPSESSLEASHRPFPHNLPTIYKFEDSIEVMKSLAKPRKITLRADNGRIFSFLGKPKDDLRKDARLMDFNAMINKLLKKNSDSRRRQLHIRTYSVVTLNEESGLIQWVPNTIPMRPVLVCSYEIRNIPIWGPATNQAYARLKELPQDQVAEYFVREILSKYPPVFHEWFVGTFPEPSTWLASRLSFARTAAVMSMDHSLGDRHAENILLDLNTGSVIHVDFDCLFERGKRLETPERVPFRLTQNMQDGLGVTNVDGPFRIACEITMALLRRNKDCLMSVLDAFIHDPLVEWEDEKKRMEKQRKSAAQRRRSHVNLLKDEVDLRKLAKDALLPIQKKLQGIYAPGDARDDGKEHSTGNLVEILIQEAKSNENLARMYPGWAPFL